jgi:hypothetical protein
MRRQTVVSALAVLAAISGRVHAQSVWGRWLRGSGIGLTLSSTDAHGLQGLTDANSGASGVLGVATASSGNAVGVWGQSYGDAGSGVYGEGRFGVYGDTIWAQGAGVYGFAQEAKGQNYGVIGETRSPQGTGVYGTAPYPGNAGYFAGNTVVAAPGSLSFGAVTRQMLNLWGPGTYGIGVQNYVLYFRTDSAAPFNGFAWYKGGVHANNPYDPGGGTMLMMLDQAGLTVNGTFISSSDAAMKQDVEALDVQQVLEAVGRLKVQQWSYKASPEVRHVGPMAQDFQAAFGVGADDTHIAMVDADGVALASIQALRQLVAAQQDEIRELRAQMAEQDGRIERLLAQQAR